MLIISEFTSTSFTLQVKARISVVIVSSFRVHYHTRERLTPNSARQWLILTVLVFNFL